MKTEYVLIGDESYKRAVIYTDQIDENGKIKYSMSVKPFVPYFYVLEDAIVPAERNIIKVESGFKGICGEKLKRIYTRLPTDVSYLRDRFSNTWEADCLFPWRYRIDHSYVIKDNVRLFLDIEVAMGSRFDKTSFRYPITCVSVYDTGSKEYVVFTWRGDLEKAVLHEKRLERIKRKDANGNDEKEYREMSYRIFTYSNEKDMISGLCKHIVSVNPDVLSAWNSSFDYPYIINRMQVLQLDPGVISPIHFVGIDKFDGDAIIKGRYVLDLLAAYRKIHIGQLEGFKLDDVGLFEFKVPKIKVESSFEDLWKKDINSLVEYNIADLELCVRLDEKKDIMKFFESVSDFTGVPLDETLSNSRVLDFYYLREAYKDGIRLPTARKDNAIPSFEGALVIEPIKGLHKNVACFDLTALYPNIIIAGNMSLETIDLDGDIKFENGVSFKSSPEGFISSRIKFFLNRRNEIKKEMLAEFEKNGKSEKYKQLDSQQNVAKFLSNCFSDDTDVLTPTGIKNIKDFNVGDEVYSVNPETLKTEIKKVTRIYKYRYKDNMIIFKDNKVDFCVTPNHRMFVSFDSINFKFIFAEDLLDKKLFYFIDTNNNIHKYNSNLYNVLYDGYVYCVEVEDNHTLYAGRNGKFQAVGQSIYGLLGFNKSRYYLEDIAKTITFVGREINLHTQKIVADNGFVVVAGDTDSVYVKFPDDYDLDKCLSVGKDLQNKINNSYANFSERFSIKNVTFNIKYEKLYRKMIACKKKRYIGQLWYKEGIVFDEAKYGKDIEVTGFSSRRSDTSKFSKEFLKKLYVLLINEVPVKEVYKYITDSVDEFKRADIEDIAIPKNFTKEFNLYEGGSANSVFINSAKMCNLKYGMDIGGGSKILFIYAKTGPGGFCWSRGNSDILKKEGIRVDYEKMLERGIYMQLSSLFEALNMSVEDLKTGTTQLKLEDWFE